jgi:hypothetical protein
LIAGVLLVLVGAWFLATQFVPGLGEWFNIEFTWPLIIIAVGAFLLVFGLLVGAPGMAVPACIVGGIGGILYWQNLTQDWDSWAYVWTLIPGFVGIGTILAGLLGENTRSSVEGGSWLVIISLVLFLIFSSFTSERSWLGPYWPILLIVAGVLMIVRILLRRTK